MIERRGRALPWTDEELFRWLVTVVLAAGLCVAAWWAAAGHARLRDQIAFANFAVAGLVLTCYAHAALFLRGRRAVGARRRALLTEPPEHSGSRSAADSRQFCSQNGFVAGDGLGRYHRPDCPLAAGRDWSEAARADHDAAGRRPCGVCRP